MATIVGTTATLDDVLAEATDGQYIEVDLADASGALIDTATIVSLVGTLRSLDTLETVFADDDLLASSRASYPGAAGRVRVTFLDTDMVTFGPREYQRRELTLAITHSVDRRFHCAVRFYLQNLGDVV